MACPGEPETFDHGQLVFGTQLHDAEPIEDISRGDAVEVTGGVEVAGAGFADLLFPGTSTIQTTCRTNRA